MHQASSRAAWRVSTRGEWHPPRYCAKKARVHEADFPGGVRALAWELMELADRVGAERHEPSSERNGYRNGYRERPWDTPVAGIAVRVLRKRDGTRVSVLVPQTILRAGGCVLLTASICAECGC